MSRQFDGRSESIEYHRRPNQPYDTAPNYGSRESPRVYPMSRASPLQDQESEKGEQQPRRRIGLACSRCRKRKIKCSGDVGGGCQNCKNAGAEECNFLRVNSTTVLTSSTTLDYPYSNASSMSLPASMGRAHGGMGSEYLGAYGPMPPPGTAPYTGRAGSYSGQQYSSLASRHSHPSVAHYSYSNMNDHSYDQYTQAPQYLLPAQDPQSSMSSAYGAQDMSRQWTPMASNRHSMSGLDDPSFKYGTSGFPYLNSSAVASVGPDGFGMNSLNRALPRGDRILPNPRRSSVETSSNSHQKSGESASYGLPPGLGHRSSVAWSPQTLTNAASRGSTSSTSLSALSGSLSNVSSSPPVESNQGTTTFGYVPLSSSPLHQSITVPHAPTHDTMNKTAEKGSSLRDMAYPKTRTILPMRSSSSLYSWDTGAASKTGSTADPQDSDHTLVNGKQYTRIRQQPIKHNPGDPLPVEKAPSMVSTHNVATVTTQSRQR